MALTLSQAAYRFKLALSRTLAEDAITNPPLRDEYRIRYLVTDRSRNVETENGSVRTLVRDSKVTLYELRPD